MKKNKKIAFLLTSLVAGGEERIASVLAPHIAQKQDLHLVLFNEPIDFDLPSNIRVKILRPVYKSRVKRILTLPIIVWSYYRYCQQANITHSISFDNLPNFVNCLIKRFGWQGKAYLREVNHVSTRYPDTTLYGQIYRWLIRKLYPYADRLFMNAKRIGKDLQENYGLKIPMTLSVNPIDMAKIVQQGAIAIATNNIYTFIHVGAFRPQKNHELLIRAFAEIRDLPIQLWLLGKGDLMPEIKQLVIDLDLEEQVTFWDYQSNPFQFMAAADCMVMSSHFEGLPNVFLEGLACGLPIVSTDCPSGPREVLAPNTPIDKRIANELELAEYGILTPIGDATKLAEAMELMYRNERYRKGAFFKQRVAPFRVEKVVAELMEKLEM